MHAFNTHNYATYTCVDFQSHTCAITHIHALVVPFKLAYFCVLKGYELKLIFIRDVQYQNMITTF